jgi:transposase
MKNYELTEDQWEKIKDFLPGRKETCGVTAKDNRMFINGVLWVLRSGARWRDLPLRYGNWKSSHKRFTRWAAKGIWEKIFKMLTKDADNECIMIDATIVKAHQHAARVKKKPWKQWGTAEEA